MTTVGREGRPAWPAGTVREAIRVPDPVILPDPTTLFARQAARFDRLATGHPMAEWLRFMATLARAQQSIGSQLPALTPLDSEWVAKSVTDRRPPLAPFEHPRQHLWRKGLTLLLDVADDPGLPAAARHVAQAVRGHSPDALEALADRCLQRRLEPGEGGEALYVTAALQVYFVRLAASLDVTVLRVLEHRGLCPVCGGTPASSVVTASGRAPGTRFLHCSLCATAWNHMRAVCTICGGSRSLTLREIEGGNGAVKAEACGECLGYVKVLYAEKDPHLDPVADDLATLGLDMLVSEAGWSRSPPLLLGDMQSTQQA
jgi:FdhE protein